jgi:lysophospholipase
VCGGGMLDCMQTTWLERRGEPTLRVAIWQPPVARGWILITPGYAESIERWEHAAEGWRDAGLAVAAYDLRGQGRSQGRRGHIESFTQFTDDLFAVWAHVRERFAPPAPPIAFGHSLGALITTVAALDRPTTFRGLGLASPFWGLALKPARWKVVVGKRLTNIWPTYSDAARISLDLLTHDKSRVAMMQADPLRIERVTARWFTETERARERVQREFALLSLPVFCLAAGEDYVADVGVTRRIFAGSKQPNHVLEVKSGAYHELHQELERDDYLAQFQRQFTAWCDAHD